MIIMKNLCIFSMVIVGIFFTACGSSPKITENAAQRRSSEIAAAQKNWNEAMKAEDWVRAVDAYTDIINMYPDYVSAYDARGIAYLCIGEKEKAKNDFYEALKKEPDRLSTKQNILHISAPTEAVIAYRRGSNPDVKRSIRIEAFTEAINLYSDYFNAYNDRGVQYFYKYMMDEAEADWNKAYEMWPDHNLVLYNLARIYRFNGDYDKAIEYLERSIKMNPDYRPAKDELAEVQKLKNPGSSYASKSKAYDQYMRNALIKLNLEEWDSLSDAKKEEFREEYPDVYKARFED